MAPLFVVLIGFLLGTPARAHELEAVYGPDDRREVDDPANAPAMREAAKSVAVVVPRSKVLPASAGDDPQTFRTLSATTFQARYNICPSERFLTQPAPGYCTAFLVGPDRMVTAGHCVKSGIDCSNTAFVFGFDAAADHPRPERVRKDDVYYCRSLLARASDQDAGVDFTVFKLDRPVTGRRPLPLRRTGQIDWGEDVTVIGHPNGLPLKIAAGGHVRPSNTFAYFVVNSDTFTGNSGSPVINDETGLVEGVLVRGEADFHPMGGCNMIKRCDEIACRGEDVVRSDTFMEWVP